VRCRRPLSIVVTGCATPLTSGHTCSDSTCRSVQGNHARNAAHVTRRTLLNASLAGAVSLSVAALAPRPCLRVRSQRSDQLDPAWGRSLASSLAPRNVVASGGRDGLSTVTAERPDRSAELLEARGSRVRRTSGPDTLQHALALDHTGSNEASQNPVRRLSLTKIPGCGSAPRSLRSGRVALTRRGRQRAAPADPLLWL